MKKALVGGHYYTIKEDKTLPSRGIYGFCDMDKKEIHTHNLKDHATLIHELIHAALHEAGITQAITQEVNEIISENLSQMMNRLFVMKERKTWKKK